MTKESGKNRFVSNALSAFYSQQEPVKGRRLPVAQVPLENSVESHWKFSEIPLGTSENLLETS